ncbi:hypothetical protein [Falsiroseomonas sp. CW058]|uniref:hypothetical protein n=1 Tax=Falsiroseomonas sp. CW058 TaxID=3388664 RepID=UPI003D31E272
MTPHAPTPPALPEELIAASLLTSAQGSEVQLIATDGRRFRVPADEETARSLVLSLWRALDRPS